MSDLNSKRPKDTALRQQRLSAFKPVHTIKSTVIIFLIFSVLFFSIGVAFYLLADQVIEVRERYDDQCEIDQQCNVEIQIKDKMTQPIYFYYELVNFYQNHRKFVKSRNDLQLKGEDLGTDELDKCDPAIKMKDMYKKVSISGQTLKQDDPANPCGLAARSVFNDTYILYDQSNKVITIDQEDIAWASDKSSKFQRPSDYKNIQWIDSEDEHFIVWMRIAAMPMFRKLWGKIDTDLEGDYQLQIMNLYDVDEWDGEKYVVFTTTNIFGGKNVFIGILFIVAGAVCFVSALIYMLRYVLGSKVDYTDLSNLKWN